VNWSKRQPSSCLRDNNLRSPIRVTYGTGVISEEVNNGVLLGHTKLLFPGLGSESVVDGDDVDALDALGRELLCLGDVAGNLRGAWWREGTRNTDDNVLASKAAEVNLWNGQPYLNANSCSSLTVPCSGLFSFNGPVLGSLLPLVRALALPPVFPRILSLSPDMFAQNSVSVM
jgi:hypothetical protein